MHGHIQALRHSKDNPELVVVIMPHILADMIIDHGAFEPQLRYSTVQFARCILGKCHG